MGVARRLMLGLAALAGAYLAGTMMRSRPAAVADAPPPVRAKVIVPTDIPPPKADDTAAIPNATDVLLGRAPVTPELLRAGRPGVE